MSGSEQTPFRGPDSTTHVSTERAAFEERRRLRRQRRKRRMLMAGVALVLAVALTALTAWLTYQNGMRNLSATRKMIVDPLAGRNDGSTGPEVWTTNRVTVLLVGTDEQPDNKGRTDTMMLVSYDPDTGEAGVLSIPRDTRVQIPGQSGYHRVNAAHVYGGPQLALRTVEQLLGIPIDYYVVVDFAGFERFIDLLGGVTMLVERPMRYDDFAQGLHIDIQPGLQLLNGEQALHYVRFRADRLGDVSLVDPARELYDGRVKRQLDFVKAVAAQALSWKTLPKLPQLVPQLFAMVETNMSYDRAMALVVSLRDFDTTRLDVAVLPGTSDVVGGASYWVHDPVRTRAVIDRVIRGERIVNDGSQVIGRGVSG